MTNPTNPFNWQMPTASDLVTDLPADFETFGQAVATSMADLLGGTTGQVLSKASNTDMDFTWVTTDDANAIQNSIVDAKGDLIAASANDTPARLAVGNNGETLVADSSTSTGLSYQANWAAGKNKIINGNFGIWQRGTSFAPIAGGAYSADRFIYGQNGTGNVTVSQQTFTLGTAPVAGYEGTYFQRSAVTTTGTATYIEQTQRIEDVRTFAGQTVTLSFWAKADSARSSIVYLTQAFGSGGSSSVLTSTPAITYSTNWTRYSYTFTLASIAGKTIGTGSYLGVSIRSVHASSSTLDLWGVQVEAGSVATAFQTATGTIQGELAACQRYYYEKGGDANYEYHAACSVSSTTEAFGTLILPVQMRVTPSGSVSAASDFACGSATGVAQACTAVAFQSSGTKSAGIKATTGGGLVAGNSSTLFSNNTTSARIKLSAEL